MLIGGLGRGVRVLQIATVGEDVEPILVGVRELPVSKLVLLYTPDVGQVVHDLRQRLEAVKVPVDAYIVKGDPVVQVMSLVAEILRKEMLQYDRCSSTSRAGRRCSPARGCPPLS